MPRGRPLAVLVALFALAAGMSACGGTKVSDPAPKSTPEITPPRGGDVLAGGAGSSSSSSSTTGPTGTTGASGAATGTGAAPAGSGGGTAAAPNAAAPAGTG